MNWGEKDVANGWYYEAKVNGNDFSYDRKNIYVKPKTNYMLMKRILFGLMSVVLLAIGSGCSQNEDGMSLPEGYDGDISYAYLLNLRIVDGNGKDLLEDIYAESKPFEWSDGDSVTRIVDDHSLTTTEVIGSDVYENRTWHITIDEKGRKALKMYFKIGTSFNQHSPHYDMEIKSPDIFGDAKVHEIKSSWKHKGYTNMCSEVTFDGVKCPLTVSKEEKSIWLKDVTVYYYDVVIVADGE